MPLQDYNQKKHQDLGIPLQDDYFLEEPEAIVQTRAISIPETTINMIAGRI